MTSILTSSKNDPYVFCSTLHGLSNAVYRFSMRCVVLKISGGGLKSTPPAGSRLAQTPAGARVILVGPKLTPNCGLRRTQSGIAPNWRHCTGIVHIHGLTDLRPQRTVNSAQCTSKTIHTRHRPRTESPHRKPGDGAGPRKTRYRGSQDGVHRSTDVAR